MGFHDDSSFATHLAAARQALESENLSEALRHIASALAVDPNHSEALPLLETIIAAADDPLNLFPDDGLPSTSAMSAVHAYLLAHQDRVPEAIDQLLGVIAERPDVLYIDWVLGWLPRSEVAGQLDVDKLACFLGTLLEQFPALTTAHGGGRDTLARVPLFIQLIRRTHLPNAHFLTAAVALLGRLGNLDEALQLAREAHTLEPGLQTAIALASTHAARNELDQALAIYRGSVGQDPTDMTARVQMADLLVYHGRFQEALDIYNEVLERDPGHEVAQPSVSFLRLVQSGDESWRDQLLDLVQEQPGNERAQRLA